MTAFRRTRHNFALDHAIDRAREFSKPLLIFEPLRTRYSWASDRTHRFVIEGMRDNRAATSTKNVTYFPYVEPKPGAGTPLLHRLAKRACTVVTDDFPCFFLPNMIRAVQERLPARLELIDSNGLIPMRLPERTFTVAHSYRRWMQKNILSAMEDVPKANPLSRLNLPKLEGVPAKILQRWPVADLDGLLQTGGLAAFPIDHKVSVCSDIPGGQVEARRRLKAFAGKTIKLYGTDRNHPDEKVTTGLSPHLHFGHISAHEIINAVLDSEQWNPSMCSVANGKNQGFWNTSEPAEGFLDQMLTWREMGFNKCVREPESYDRFESLPEWAQLTLNQHADDPRPSIYELDQFESASTHDELWNAAQRELVQTGGMHNYMRMLWGKKILHWSETPQQALATMIHLNNKYALDGRDPNSYSGIFWVLGRYDRAWGPKRPVFGSIRYMTSESARKKLRLKKYLARFSGMAAQRTIPGIEPD